MVQPHKVLLQMVVQLCKMTPRLQVLLQMAEQLCKMVHRLQVLLQVTSGAAV